jgi:hypothetical protein
MLSVWWLLSRLSSLESLKLFTTPSRGITKMDIPLLLQRRTSYVFFLPVNFCPMSCPTFGCSKRPMLSVWWLLSRLSSLESLKLFTTPSRGITKMDIPPLLQRRTCSFYRLTSVLWAVLPSDVLNALCCLFDGCYPCYPALESFNLFTPPSRGITKMDIPPLLQRRTCSFYRLTSVLWAFLPLDVLNALCCPFDGCYPGYPALNVVNCLSYNLFYSLLPRHNDNGYSLSMTKLFLPVLSYWRWHHTDDGPHFDLLHHRKNCYHLCSVIGVGTI